MQHRNSGYFWWSRGWWIGIHPKKLEPQIQADTVLVLLEAGYVRSDLFFLSSHWSLLLLFSFRKTRLCELYAKVLGSEEALHVSTKSLQRHLWERHQLWEHLLPLPGEWREDYGKPRVGFDSEDKKKLYEHKWNIKRWFCCYILVQLHGWGSQCLPP